MDLRVTIFLVANVSKERFHLILDKSMYSTSKLKNLSVVVDKIRGNLNQNRKCEVLDLAQESEVSSGS